LVRAQHRAHDASDVKTTPKQHLVLTIEFEAFNLIQILYRDQILEEFTMPRRHAPAPTPPTAAAGSSAHPILHTPDDIAGWRRAFFTLEQDLHLSVEQFNQL
jgi:hypothetical protein